jgi:hypothetical protein
MADVTDSITPLRNDKRERKHNAQSLPPGITHNMMKKFVVYYREMTYLKSGKQQPREYFKVESHPKLSKPWVSSKSAKISLVEKLNHANQVVADLEGETGVVAICAAEEDITTVVERWSKHLPKYMMLRIGKSALTPTPTPTPTPTLSLIYDRKDNQYRTRWTSSYTFSVHSIKDADAIISASIAALREKIRDKYNLDVVSI